MKLVSQNIVNSVFQIQHENDFNNLCLEVFQIHAQYNSVYKEFLRWIKTNPDQVDTIEKIPFLPIQFFKSHKVGLPAEHHDLVFKSSGTTGTKRSQHFVYDQNVYIQSFFRCFETFYGAPQEYHIFGLLPSYLEQGDSSLVFMVDHLIKASGSHYSGFYLDDFKTLEAQLHESVEKDPRKIILFGVSYALLEFSEQGFSIPPETIVMETGGMKGRRKEITKDEMYQTLTSSLQVDHIHSEYGMTELLSQAYSTQNNIFRTPAWMKILIRNPNDFREIYPFHKTGGMNIIDLANIHSCPFIATDDLGQNISQDTFTVLGRFDHSDLRGCNLLVSTL